MATVATTPRTNRFTLASASAGPFLVGFRLFASDGIDVLVDGVRQTSGFTVGANFIDGYDDNATVTFSAALPSATVIQFDGALRPGRGSDYANPDPTLTAKLNIELARLWSSVAEINQLVRRSVRALDPLEAVDGITAADLEALPANLAAAAAAATTATGAATTATTARDQVLAIQDSLPEWRGPWVTARAYGIGDLVSQAGSSYICIVAHTSGTFSTDLSNARWQMFAQQGAAGAGTGDMLAANNLSDVANAATARANLSAQASNALLSAIAALSSNGFMSRTGAGTAVARSLVAGSGIGITNGDGASGNPTITAQDLGMSNIATASKRLAGSGGASTNDAEIPSSAWVREAVRGYLNAGGDAPIFAARAFVNFNAIPLAGTYTRTGTTVTVTMTAHGMTTGQAARFVVSSGGATSNYTAVVTVVDANTFTYTDSASGSTSGNLSRDIWLRAWGNVLRVDRNGTGDYTIVFFTALPTANYAVLFGVGSTVSGNTSQTAQIHGSTSGATLKTTTQLRINVGSTANGVPNDNHDISVTVII